MISSGNVAATLRDAAAAALHGAQGIWQVGVLGFTRAALCVFMLIGVGLGTLKISGDIAYCLMRLVVPALNVWGNAAHGPQVVAWLVVYLLQTPLWLHASPGSLMFWEQMLTANLLHSALLHVVGSERGVDLPSTVLKKMIHDPDYEVRRLREVIDVSTHLLLILTYIGAHGPTVAESNRCLTLFLFNEVLSVVLCASISFEASLQPDPWTLKQPYVHRLPGCLGHEACPICLEPLCVAISTLAQKYKAARNSVRTSASRTNRCFNTSVSRATLVRERWNAVTLCEHEFHAVCLEESLDRRGACPLCRKSLMDDPLGEMIQLDEREAAQLFFMFRGALIGASMLAMNWVLEAAQESTVPVVGV